MKAGNRRNTSPCRHASAFGLRPVTPPERGFARRRPAPGPWTTATVRSASDSPRSSAIVPPARPESQLFTATHAPPADAAGATPTDSGGDRTCSTTADPPRSHSGGAHPRYSAYHGQHDRLPSTSRDSEPGKAQIVKDPSRPVGVGIRSGGARLPTVTIRRNRYGRGSGPTGRWRCRRPAPVDCPLRREGARTGSARCSTVLARRPQRRIPASPNATHRKRSGKPVWTWEQANRKLALSRAAPVDVPCAGRAPGPDRLAVRRCLPDGRNAGYRDHRTLTTHLDTDAGRWLPDVVGYTVGCYIHVSP